MLKQGILLVNLGTPDEPTRGAVYRYLKQFLLDPRVIDISALGRNLLVRGIIAPFRSGKSAKLYQQLWTDNGSPIKHYGERVRDLLSQELGEGYEVVLGMRYQNPSITSALMDLRSRNVRSITVLPLFPQYASATTGSVHEEVMRIVSQWQSIPEMRFISSFETLPAMVRIFAENGARHQPETFDHVLFSFHGLPQRQLVKADHNHHCLKVADCCQTLTERNHYCYSAQCYATARAIATQLGLPAEKWTVCFQSRLGRDPWAQPYTSEVLKARAAAGDKRVLVFSPAFVADCLETIIEIGYEYQHEWTEMGGEKVQLVESLNDDPRWVSALRDLVAPR